MDICSIDKDYHWHDYRRKTLYKEWLLLDKKEATEPLICYYSTSDSSGKPVVLLEMHTTTAELWFWFIIPWLILIVCIAGIIRFSLWYKKLQQGEQVEDYQQITGSEHDPTGVKEPL